MRPVAAVALLVLLGLAFLPSAAAASAPAPVRAAVDPTAIQIVTPSELVAGVQTTLVAHLQDTATAAPVPGGILSFAEKTTFGWLVLGNVTTDDLGEAGVPYEPVHDGTYTIAVAFAGDANYSSSNASLALTVLAASSPPPPFLTTDQVIVLVIVLVVGSVWATYAFVASQILGIRRIGSGPEDEEFESKERKRMEEKPSGAEAPPKRVPGIANANRAVVGLAVAALVLAGAAIALVGMGGLGHTQAYTPSTVSLQVTVIPDFRGTGWDSFVPDELVVHAGDTVKITVYNEDTGMAHGFVIDALGVSVQLPAASQDAGGNITPSVTPITFTVTSAGSFTWYCNDPCGPGHLTMTGTLVVLPDD